jgi:hypothetical protein
MNGYATHRKAPPATKRLSRSVVSDCIGDLATIQNDSSPSAPTDSRPIFDVQGALNAERLFALNHDCFVRSRKTEVFHN